MKQNLKRMLALALAVLMACALFAGCTKTPASSAAPTPSKTESGTVSQAPEKLDPVELVLLMNQNAATGDKQVQDAVNKLDAMKAINTTVKFDMLADGDKFNDKISLVLSSDEPCDIVVADISSSYIDHAKAGAYADITDLIENKYTKLRDALLPEHWQLAKVNGKIYGVSTYKEMCTDWGFYISHKFVEEKNINLENRTLSNIDDILQALKDDGRETFMLTFNQLGFFTNITTAEKYISLQDSNAVVSFDDPKKVVCFYETEDFKNEIKQARERYQKGLIAQDIATVENYKAQLADETKYGLQITNHAPLAELPLAASKGFDVDFLPLTKMTMVDNAGWINCVNAKSKNIDRAVRFMEVWNTDPTVKNTITFGVEGVNFDLVDGQVDYSKYPDHSEFWRGDSSRLGNQMISYTTLGEPKDKWETYQKYNKTARKVPTSGFFFDKTDVANEIAALSAVTKEYHLLLCSGTDENYEATYEKFIAALKTAGLQKIIAEAQKQLDAFYASQK